MSMVARGLKAISQGRLPSAVRQRLEPLIEVTAAIRVQIQEPMLRGSLKLPATTEKSPPAISRHGDFSATPEAQLLGKALDLALNQESPLPADIRAIEGMSGQKYRALINHLIRNHPDPKYLEVGSWAGSTAAAALCGNTLKALCVDNWSEFGGPRDAFFENIGKVRTDKIDFNLLESDFRKVDFGAIGPFNVYLFDGPHAEQDQYDGVALAQPALTPRAIVIVDDWNWRAVRVGTFRALADTNCRVEAAVEVRTTLDDSHPEIDSTRSDWHNGYFLAVVSKG